jgi:hypothetical protein
LQQLHAQVRLQLLDQHRHRRTRQLQAVGGLGETAQLDNPGKHAHGVEAVHRATPELII